MTQIAHGETVRETSNMISFPTEIIGIRDDMYLGAGHTYMKEVGEALYMHCLPADISGVSCEKGEVSAAVFENYRIATYKEAGYKPYIIAAMMLTNRFENVADLFENLDKSRLRKK
jgi:ornithine carbamoyltransferase